MSDSRKRELLTRYLKHEMSKPECVESMTADLAHALGIPAEAAAVLVRGMTEHLVVRAPVASDSGSGHDE